MLVKDLPVLCTYYFCALCRSISDIAIPVAGGIQRSIANNRHATVDAFVSLQHRRSACNDEILFTTNIIAKTPLQVPSSAEHVGKRSKTGSHMEELWPSRRARVRKGHRFGGLTLEAALVVEHFAPGEHPVLYIRVRYFHATGRESESGNSSIRFKTIDLDSIVSICVLSVLKKSPIVQASQGSFWFNLTSQNKLYARETTQCSHLEHVNVIEYHVLHRQTRYLLFSSRIMMPISPWISKRWLAIAGDAAPTTGTFQPNYECVATTVVRSHCYCRGIPVLSIFKWPSYFEVGVLYICSAVVAPLENVANKMVAPCPARFRRWLIRKPTGELETTTVW